jgi:hypothetical protein
LARWAIGGRRQPPRSGPNRFWRRFRLRAVQARYDRFAKFLGWCHPHISEFQRSL